MPHARTDLGICAPSRAGTAQRASVEFEHFWKDPVELILGLFGLANAGVVLSSVGTGAWLVLAGLLVGASRSGITLFTWLGASEF